MTSMTQPIDAQRLTSSDYARDVDPERSFAERRGITFRERVVELIEKVVPEKVRGLFDGLKLNVPAAAPRLAPGMFDGLRVPVPVPEQKVAEPQVSPAEARDRIIARHARAVQAIFQMQDGGG
ncbi:MAG: hypothetical protein ABIS14_08555 [Sphingomonas sp.]